MAQTLNRPLAKQRRAMGRYHWALLALSIIVTVLVAAPTLWAQPILYETSAVVTIDPARYPAYFGDPAIQKTFADQAIASIKQKTPGFGSALFNIEILPQADGTARVRGFGPSAAAAQEAVNQGAFRLTQNVRAAAGRDVLRRLMNTELYGMIQTAAPPDELARRIRTLIAVEAFDFSLHAAAEPPRITTEDYNDITRALQVRSEQLSAQLNQAGLSDSRKRELFAARNAVDSMLQEFLYPTYISKGTEPSAAYISAPALLPAAPRPQNTALKLGLVLLAGLVGGLLLVFVDRAIGIVEKANELWSYRELLRNLVVRDLKARYKSSVLGYVWSLLNPLLMIMLFYIVFRVLLGSPITNFHIFLMVALLPWNYFAGAISEGVGSIIGNGNLVKKVYFPREVLPIATMLANLVNFLLSLPVLFAVMLLTGGEIAGPALLLPVIIVIESVFILGMVLLLSSVSVFYRDTAHIMGVILQLWFFVTPIFYPLEQIARPDISRLVRWLNPMASIIDFYRDILYGGLSPHLPTPGLPALDGVARTALTSLAVLAFGAYIFHRLSGRFGEEL